MITSENSMTTPLYLLDKLGRHGHAVERLRGELRRGEADPHDPVHAISFDAANFVWSFLVLSGLDHAQDTREVRNRVAEAIMRELEAFGVATEDLNFEPPAL
jgi:hypothetical protein